MQGSRGLCECFTPSYEGFFFFKDFKSYVNGLSQFI